MSLRDYISLDLPFGGVPMTTYLTLQTGRDNSYGIMLGWHPRPARPGRLRYEGGSILCGWRLSLAWWRPRKFA